jgi:hypothetical protein
MKANQEKMEVMDLKGNPEEMECESEHQETPKEDAIVESVKGRKKRYRGRKLAAGDTKVYQETTACQNATEVDMEKNEPDPGMMQSAVEHQDIPTEDAAIMPVGEPRKQRSVRKLAMESHQKIKDRTLGNHEFKRKSPAACRMVSRHAAVARSKGNTFRKLQTKENCGLWRKFVAACRGMTYHAEMAWHREQGHKRYDQDCVAPGSPEGWTSRIRCWKGPE